MLPVELSAAVLLVDVFFDFTRLRLEESVVISVEVEVSGGVRLLVGRVSGFGKMSDCVCFSTFFALGEWPVVFWDWEELVVLTYSPQAP